MRQHSESKDEAFSFFSQRLSEKSMQQLYELSLGHFPWTSILLCSEYIKQINYCLDADKGENI